MRHKKKLFKKCWRLGLRKQAITHDISKFLPSEFIPYAKWFSGDRGFKLQNVIHGMDDEVRKEYEINKRNFEAAVQKHYSRNTHHWNHWLGHRYEMIIPLEDLQELVCDWEAVGERHGNTAQEYYLRNYYQIELNDNNRLTLECLLELNSDMFTYSGKTIGEVLIEVVYNESEENRQAMIKIFNNIYETVNFKHDLDIYSLINESNLKLQ